MKCLLFLLPLLLSIVQTYQYPQGNQDDCTGKPCGADCNPDGPGICDGRGFCVSPLENPCLQQGCYGKQCGEDCLQGDIVGTCDSNGECNFVGGVSCPGGCIDNEGNKRREGEAWACDCNRCRCSNGNIASTKKLCGKGCIDNEGNMRKDGEAWACDCNKCRCSNGNIASTKKFCGAGGGCTCNGLILGNNYGECRTKYRGRVFCYVDNDSSCPDSVPSVQDTSVSWSYTACSSSCPKDPPTGECKILGLKCEYREKCCCGSCGPSLVAKCASFGWDSTVIERCDTGCGECMDGYQIFPGDTYCCSSTIIQARCCHKPGDVTGREVFCT